MHLAMKQQILERYQEKEKKRTEKKRVWENHLLS